MPLIALAEWKVQAWPADKLPPHSAQHASGEAGVQRASVMLEMPFMSWPVFAGHDPVFGTCARRYAVTKLRLGVNIDHVATVRNARGW